MSHMVYPTTNFKAVEQMTIERGDGIYVYDNHGKQYLEGMSGLWCASLGFNNAELIEAATKQMEKLSYAHMFGGKVHEPGMQLADKLSAMVPVENAHIFMGSSGSDANDSHIKMLRYYFAAIGKPEKRKIIARERSYHGVTVAAACLTGLPINQTNFDLPIDALGILRTDAPHYLRGKIEGESEADFVNRIVANLEAMILREGPETIAAFIAEPITGASGVIVPPAGYYEKVQAVLNKYDILFWADEVITGFGRTGNDFGVTTMGIKPDLMSFAKQLSSSYVPISASVIPGKMYDAMVDETNRLGVFGHGYTYSAHPLAAAVALKTLEIYERDNTFAKAAETGEYLQARLAEFNSHPLVGEVRGAGMIAAVELVADKDSKAAFPDGKVGYFAANACQQHGLISRPVAGSSLALCPPLITTKAQIDEIVEKMGKALDDTMAFVQQQG
ncbi:aminotransferase [Oceanobacter mangrovi]|uniref:aminotransferase n=1 Tax=Oceanobacter mangrovi TaxID=2862510 RepID=UPI001C8E2DA6|nr:aminotransferase [Oceanobacter mangrovi]